VECSKQAYAQLRTDRQATDLVKKCSCGFLSFRKGWTTQKKCRIWVLSDLAMLVQRWRAGGVQWGDAQSSKDVTRRMT
jgi:hypothetical protein